MFKATRLKGHINTSTSCAIGPRSFLLANPGRAFTWIILPWTRLLTGNILYDAVVHEVNYISGPMARGVKISPSLSNSRFQEITDCLTQRDTGRDLRMTQVGDFKPLFKLFRGSIITILIIENQFQTERLNFEPEYFLSSFSIHF